MCTCMKTAIQLNVNNILWAVSTVTTSRNTVSAIHISYCIHVLKTIIVFKKKCTQKPYRGKPYTKTK